MKKAINNNSPNMKLPHIQSSLPTFRTNIAQYSSREIKDESMKKIKELLKQSNKQLLEKLLGRKPIHSYIEHLVSSNSKLQPFQIPQASLSIQPTISSRKDKKKNLVSICKNEIKKFEKLRHHFLNKSSIGLQLIKTQNKLNQMQHSAQKKDQLLKKKKIVQNKNLVKYYRNKKEIAQKNRRSIEYSNQAILNFISTKDLTKNSNAIKLKKYADIPMEQFLANSPQQQKSIQRYVNGKIRAKANKQRKSYSENKIFSSNNGEFTAWSNTQVFIYDYQNPQF